MIWSVVNAQRLVSLHPDARPIMQAIYDAACAKWPGGFAIVQGVRTDADQAKLYAQGRTAVGPNASPEHPLGSTVTQAATAHDTPHGCACAIDLVFLVNGQPSWDQRLPWGELGALGESLGAVWGGRFPHADLDHFEHPRWRHIRDAATLGVAS